ncbi:hypothetical protein CSOJ01_03817 [Colletotrichum sojae]|uniref:Uncharacterized protein n=1 Tax=Colletotrichum sojae TaxID=2175907 RepID=A0A8H6JLA9_9PEZI|nr:hypothetical protein CSOJ01_03817 [Colletotrichum sojae]
MRRLVSSQSLHVQTADMEIPLRDLSMPSTPANPLPQRSQVHEEAIGRPGEPEDDMIGPREAGEDLGEPGDDTVDQPRSSVGEEHYSGNDIRLPSESKPSEEVGCHKSRISVASTILKDCAVVLLPLGMLGSFSAGCFLDGDEVIPETRHRWLNVITVLATLFPILFASIAGRLLSETARWKLEKGSSIGTLEQLMGSRTFGSAAQNLVQFRTSLGLGLLALWVFSPLGAQAILRMLTERDHTYITHTNVSYFDNLKPPQFTSTATSSGILESFGDSPKIDTFGKLWDDTAHSTDDTGHVGEHVTLAGRSSGSYIHGWRMPP